jgi:hypothetical protein
VKRPRVIGELRSYLGILLRAGLRSDEKDPGAVFLETAGDLERDGPTPAFFVGLYRIAPDRRPAASTAIVESADEASGLRLEARRPPLWVACRFLFAVRGRSIEEELELIAAGLRTIHDHPLIAPEHIPSLRGQWAADRYPLDLIEDRDAWREAGLARPRPAVSCQAIIPIPSALSEPVERILDREIRIGERP